MRMRFFRTSIIHFKQVMIIVTMATVYPKPEIFLALKNELCDSHALIE